MLRPLVQEMPSFSAQMLSKVRYFRDYLRNPLIFRVFLKKIRTLPAICAEIRVYFQQSHYVGYTLTHLEQIAENRQV